MKVYQVLSSTLGAYRGCVATGNKGWAEKHRQTIKGIMDMAPSGSGFDNGTHFDQGPGEFIQDKLLTFSTSFHHMDEHGYHDGWTDHTIKVTPTFTGFDLKISGRDRNDIKEYIAETFDMWLSEEAPV